MSFDPGLEKNFKGMFSGQRRRRSTGGKPPPAQSDNSTPAAKVADEPKDPGKPKPDNSEPDIERLRLAADMALRERLGRHRGIERWWPRDPNGPGYELRWPGGKMAPNGIPQWGATILDFFGTNRFPWLETSVYFASGSRLAEYTRRIGEKECAWSEPELAWADAEEDPKQLFPIDVRELIRGADTRINMGLCRSMPKPGESTSQEDPNNLFLPQNYPDPWPTVPFTAPYPTLESRIPIHLLPEKLIVHDPWGVLNGHEAIDDEVNWEDKPDHVYTYSLTLSKEGRAQKEKSKAEALAKWEEECKKPREMIIKRGSNPDKDGTVAAQAVVELPPPPRPVTEIAEGHVYFSRTEQVGEGNHSYVYNVEWELPRSVFFPPVLCTPCIEEAVEKVVEERYTAKGRALPMGVLSTKEVLVKPGVTAEVITTSEFYRDFPGGGNRTADELEELDLDGSKHFRDGPPVVLEGVQPPNHPPDPEKMKEISGPVYKRERTYKGEIILIKRDRMNIEYQHPAGTGLGPCCHHHRTSHPPTATVRVIAKISMARDDHLEKEARNYQKFPDHFFEYWTGFNLIPPLHDPVPLNALVPQFYGYYKPDSRFFTGPRPHSGFLSSFMLLEDCGKQVKVSDLNYDEKNECASLFLRLHCAGWMHNSVYPRNVLMKTGSVFEFPVERSEKHRSFRLIDFGRMSRFGAPFPEIHILPRDDDERSRRLEERDVAQWFDPDYV